MNNLLGNIFDELKNKIKGELHTDKLRRYMLSTDGSIFKIEPLCVVYPKDVEDVIEVCKFATEYKFSIHSRGAGSGLCGSAIGRGIVLDFSKFMNKIISLDKENKSFSCQPGYRYGELELLLKDSGLFFPPAPSSGEYATFGGMYGTNAGGAYSVKYGNVADYIVDAEIVFYDGSTTKLSEISNTPFDKLPLNLKNLYQLLSSNNKRIGESYPTISCNVSGYELRDSIKNEYLFLNKILGGSEGTFCVFTNLTFRLVNKPKYDGLIVAYFNDKLSSAKAAQLALKSNPSGIEIMDKSLLDLAVTHEPILADKIPTDIDNVLMMEFDGDSLEEVKSSIDEVVKSITSGLLTQNIFTAYNEMEKAPFWGIRKAAVPILYLLKGKKKVIALVEDAAVPTDRLIEYFDGLYSIFEKHKVPFVTYGHIAKGLLHNRPLLDLKDPYDIQLLKVLADEVYELVENLGGTISGEHGDGRLRSCYIPRQYKSIYDIFLQVKSLMDPESIFNPDIKSFNDSFQMTKHLRYGSDYRATDTDMKQLVWKEDFINEVEKCHGCSKCTTVTDATRMCPIYKVSRDEAAAPKAKANVLRALLSGTIPSGSMYEDAFQYVIDHCVSCGSCFRECPSKVNIPKLALEAKSRYVERYGVSLDKKILTNFERIAKLTHKFSSVTFRLTKPKFVKKIIELLTGLSAEREFIRFDTESLYERVGKTKGKGSKVVMYFAGCYGSYTKLEIGESAVNVLKKLGYKVIIPKQYCCGIPHLSKGMAKGTRKQINKNLQSWGKLIDEVEYIVTTCSSCALSLYKEWGYYIDDNIIKKVSDKTIMVTELIREDLKWVKAHSYDIKLVYHNSCHMKLLNKPSSSFDAMSSLDGLDLEDLKSSCCGMAGSWGLMAKNYETSIKIGTPMIEKLINSEAQIGVTDCPTCAMQMEHMGNKAILNPIEVIDRCIED